MKRVIFLNNDILKCKKHIHFIGIGGSGMYPLAQILHAKGYYLTGSDNNETETLQAVRDMGIPVMLGQRAENIEGADLIVHTAAIMADNPELIAAKASGVPVLERSDLLGIVTSWYDNAICVAGTHGKTTTTSMITQALYTAGIDLSAFIGGKLPCIGGSGRSGSSDIMTCEACEFVDTFLKLYPDIAVLLNIDADHLDYFGTVENIIKSFHKFCENTTKAIIFNGDDANTCKAIEGITGKEMISYGLSDSCDYYVTDIRRVSGLETHFTVMHHGEALGEMVLHVAGEHNILNALAAVAAALYVGAGFEAVAKGLEEFRGAGRRFDKKGEACGITLVDDYAHHPTELTATLKAAMQMPFREVWAVFQPFTYSRTATHLDEFAESLSIPTHAVLTDIMGGREKNTLPIFTRQLAEKIPGAVWFPQDETDPESCDARKYANFQQVCDYVCEHAQPGDLVLTMGCGDVNKVNKMILDQLRAKEEKTCK
ncbi:MAG: UDP-N-acetylmuramate--L-alanine ligase [Ruminococcus sp.]|nr:UDP-N-acetylmuramate--L-alanine ligase [Ruminococcus sp.]